MMHNKKALFAVLTAAFALSFFAAVYFGSAKIDFFSALVSAFEGEMTTDAKILLYVRLPRACAAVISGAALAVSGVVIQAVLNNAMASPNIIGVNAGAGFAVSLCMCVLPAASYVLPVAAFAGALAACLLIYGIALKTGASRMTITLTGIAVGSILTAATNMLKTLFPDSLYNMTAFSVGGLAGVDADVLKIAGPVVAVCIAAVLILARDIDVLSLGEETAGGLGMNLGVMRFVLLVLASALAGCAVSFAGLIGFVGLVIPHIVRRFTGNRHRVLVAVSAVSGAVFVLVCDLLSRLLFKPYEIPVGILLSLTGGPFFISLILKSKRSKVYD